MTDIRYSRRKIAAAEMGQELAGFVKQGWRLGVLTARWDPPQGSHILIALLLHPHTGQLELWEAPLAPGSDHFASVTPDVPAAHWFERAIADYFGLHPEGHPRFKPLIFHEAWPPDFFPLRESSPSCTGSLSRPPYHFLKVEGDGVYEIPVGPIHAGIIEPGHFRFSCLGETIHNLEIRLGYQHRGIERKLTEVPWQRVRFLAESASTDTSVANALAHALAIEDLFELTVPPLAQKLRVIAIEIERVASHLGDLGGIASDIGYLAGAALFSRLRGLVLGIGERLTGSRFLTAYVVPGGVTGLAPAPHVAALIDGISALRLEVKRAAELFFDHPGALDRMEQVGIVKPSLAQDFGLVGPAGRSSGISYDVRDIFGKSMYLPWGWEPVVLHSGDVLARAILRVREINASLDLLPKLLNTLPYQGDMCNTLPDKLPADAVGIGIVEAWRGELIHMIFTDQKSKITRYVIKDPSFNNWTGLAIAARGELIADFPLCNKSFGLSYSGNDL